MRFRSLLFGLTSSVAIAGLVFYAFQKTSQEPINNPVFKSTPIEKGIKGALAYYAHIKQNPLTGDVDPADVMAARTGLKGLTSSKSLNMEWSEMGPSNVGGRTRAILFDKDNPSIMYAGGVSGGLWKSTTSGQSWTQIPLSGNINVSCIAQSPVDGTIYVGTGEGIVFYSGFNAGTNYNSGQYGDGVYKSEDGGNTFTLMTNTSSWNLVNRIAVDKNGKVFLATSAGLKTSTDKGATWSASKPGTCKDIKIAPNSESAVLTINGSVYITASTTNENWVQQTALPANSLRVEIGISPSNDNIIYAVIVSTTGALNSIYRTVDKGANWELIGPGGSPSLNIFGDNNQGWYDVAVLVSASNPDLVFVGGVTLWKGQKVVSGAPFAWTQISSLGEYLSSGSPNPHYVHADIHCLTQNPSNSNGFFIGCDGGIFETANNGTSFVSKNINYAVTQYYAVACSPMGWAMGGTQDNSTPYVDGSGNNPKEARVLFGGDGGWAAFSALSQDFLFATSQYGALGRSNDNGDTWQRTTAIDGTTPDFFNSQMITDNVHRTSNFVTPLLIWETTNFPNSIDSVDYVADTTYAIGDTIWARSAENDNYPFMKIATKALGTGDIMKLQDPVESRFFFGARNGVYMCDQPLLYKGFPPRWYKVANITGTVETMSISKDGDVLYFGVNNVLYRISNLLSSQDSSTLDYASTGYALQLTTVKTFAGIVTSIAIDPSDANKVAVTLGGFSSTYAHVWYSQNGTAASPTFVAKGGDLPASLPVYSSLIPISNSNTLIIGTEYGVYATENLNSASPTYSNQNSGINDPVPVFMLRQQVFEQPYMKVGRWDNGTMAYQVYPGIYNYGEIYAATHGRGLFKNTDFVGFKEIEKNNSTFNASARIYPNPANTTTTLEFELAKPAMVSATIFDLNGRAIRTMDFGMNSVGINKQIINVSDLSKGLYIIKLSSGIEFKTAKFIVQ